MADQPYDPYIPNSGAGTAQGAPGNQRTAAIQQVGLRSTIYFSHFRLRGDSFQRLDGYLGCLSAPLLRARTLHIVLRGMRGSFSDEEYLEESFGCARRGLRDPEIATWFSASCGG
jgi:hypothetical protein